MGYERTGLETAEARRAAHRDVGVYRRALRNHGRDECDQQRAEAETEVHGVLKGLHVR